MGAEATCQFDPLKTSFKQLKNAVGSTAGKKIPSAKSLRESEAEIVFTFEHGDVTINVFSNGFFIYECFGKETVSAVDRCKKIIYEYQDGEIRKIDESEFRDGPCLIPLLMSGDERVAHNLDSYEWYWHEFSLNNDGTDWNEAAIVQGPEDAMLEGEDNAEALALLDGLTVKQRQIINMFYVENMTQEEIALITKTSQQAVSRILGRAEKRLRKNK